MSSRAFLGFGAYVFAMSPFRRHCKIARDDIVSRAFSQWRRVRNGITENVIRPKRPPRTNHPILWMNASARVIPYLQRGCITNFLTLFFDFGQLSKIARETAKSNVLTFSTFGQLSKVAPETH